MNFIRYLKTDAFLIGLVCMCAIPIILPYINPGYFPTHDGEWAVVRLADMYRTVVQDQQIPARYSGYLNAGYGYPLFNFAYPHPYYMGLFFLATGLGFVASIKTLFTLSVIVSGVGMYMLSKKMWNSKLAGIASAVLYLYVPYRMVDLFVRGSIGESIAFALFPLLLWSGLKIADKDWSVYSGMVFSLLLGILVGTHNIMTVYFVPLMCIIIGVYVWTTDKTVWKRYIPALVSGIGVAAYFWLPALYEKQFIRLAEIPIADRSLYFVSLQEMIMPSWGYGIPDAADGFSYQIGIGLLITFVAALSAVLISLRKKRTTAHVLPVTLIVLTILMIGMMMRFSAVIWESLPLLREINYPWTLLSQILFVIPLLAGYVATRGTRFTYAVIASAGIALVVTVPYAHPQEYIDRGDDFYVTNDAVTTSSDEYLPLWVEEKPLVRPVETISFISGSGIIDQIRSSSTHMSAQISVDEAGVISLNRLYYPGWRIWVEDMEVIPAYDNTFGSMQIPVETGVYHVTARFSETPLRQFSNIISIVSFIVIMLIPIPMVTRYYKKL